MNPSCGFFHRFLRGLVVWLALAALVPADESIAFSLGPIRLSGALEQSFKAEVPVRTDGIEGLVVNVGDAKDYERIGVARPPLVDGLAIEVADHPIHTGQKIIYIISSEPIYQPSFNLVLKARLAGGVILENYFLALDFQKNLSLSLPETGEEREEMERIAMELEMLRPHRELLDKPEPVETVAVEDDRALLEKIRREEEEATRSDGESQSGIEVESIEPPAPVVEEKPVEIAPESIPAKSVASLTPEPTPAPEPVEPERVPETVVIEGPVKPEGGVAPLYTDPGRNVYHVKGGDTLFKIARKIGASKHDFDRVVVALWQDNIDDFIQGNIHGLLAGRTLDFSRINETVTSITRSEARKIITEQWPLWRDNISTARARPDRAAPAASERGAEKPPAAVPVRSGILAALSDWETSYNKGDMAAHLALYSDRYKSGSVTKQKLPGALTGGGFGERPVDIDEDSVTIKEKDGLIEVTFKTTAETGGLPGAMYFVKEEGAWRIMREEGARAVAHRKDRSRPYVVHIASFRDAKPARKLVQLLRKKGFNAFEVLSFVAGKGSWRRVVVDRFGSVRQAEAFSKEIRRIGLSRYTRILKLPYAIRIGSPIEYAQALERMKEYRSRGLSTYSVQDRTIGKTFILLGAFDSKANAMKTLAMLETLEAPYTVVRP